MPTIETKETIETMDNQELNLFKLSLDQLIISAIEKEDEEVATYSLYEAKQWVAQSNPLSIYSYKDVFYVFSMVFNLLQCESNFEREKAWGQWQGCLALVQEVFAGLDHLLLADFYFISSSLLSNINRLDEAMELCGRGLLLRVKLLHIHEKTAESHFHLGLLYFTKESYPSALKELILARCIYNKLTTEGVLSMAISDCDMAIGQVEYNLHHWSKSYFAFYLSYSVRYCLLGPQHALTKAVEDMIEKLRYHLSNGERFFCGKELKDRLRSLRWASTPIHSWPYAIAIYIQRLPDDAVFTSTQVKALISSAGSFKRSRLAVIATTTAMTSIEEPSDRKNVNSTSYSNDDEVLKWFQILENASVWEDRKVVVPASGGSSSSSTRAIIQNNTTAAPSILPPYSPVMSERKGVDTLSSGSREEKIQPNTVFSPLGKISVQTCATTMIDSSQQHSPGLNASTWRRIPAGSPLRSHQAPSLLPPPKESSANDLMAALSSTALITNSAGGYQLVRESSTGTLLVIRKCTPQLLKQCIISKLLAFGLIAWLSEKENLAIEARLLEEEKKKTSEKANSAPMPPHERKSSLHRSLSVRMCEARKQSVIKGVSSLNAKDALSLMFNKRFGPVDPSPTPSPVMIMSRGNDNEPVKKRASIISKNKDGDNKTPSIPIPPPIPTTWPPIPFSRQAPPESGAESPFPLPGSTPIGEGPKAANKPKFKQMQLTQLGNIEGTFWAEPQEVLLPASELFDDLDEQFTIGLKRKKSIVMHGGMKKETKPGFQTKPSNGAMSESILDPQRAQNISIMLAKFGKRSLESIADAIMNFDAEALGLSSISALMQFIPTADEVKKVTDFVNKKMTEKNITADPINSKTLTQCNIGRAEQYIHAISKVTLVEKRLTAMASVLNIAEAYPGIISQSEALLNACAEVKGSGKLRFLLRTYLDLNNLLAQRANQNVATGFHLPAWRKLSQLKTNGGETMEQYVAFKLLKTVPEALDIAGDFPSIDSGRQVMLNRIQVEVRKMQETLDLLKELQAVEGNSPLATTNLQEHIQRLSQIFSKAKEQVNLAQSDFHELCIYFGYTSASGNSATTPTPSTPGGESSNAVVVTIDPDTFFAEVKDLCRSLSSAVEVVQTRARTRRKAIKT